MAYKGKSYSNGWWLGVPPFMETPKCKYRTCKITWFLIIFHTAWSPRTPWRVTRVEDTYPSHTPRRSNMATHKAIWRKRRDKSDKLCRFDGPVQKQPTSTNSSDLLPKSMHPRESMSRQWGDGDTLMDFRVPICNPQTLASLAPLDPLEMSSWCRYCWGHAANLPSNVRGSQPAHRWSTPPRR